MFYQFMFKTKYGDVSPQGSEGPNNVVGFFFGGGLLFVKRKLIHCLDLKKLKFGKCCRLQVGLGKSW